MNTPSKGKTILVVDDEQVIRDVLKRLLLREGYDVLSAASGKEAMGILRSARPDLVLLDIAMPEMSGIEICRWIRRDSATPRLPIIMITGKSGVNDEVEGLETGADDYVTKPFNTEELIARVGGLLKGSA